MASLDIVSRTVAGKTDFLDLSVDLLHAAATSLMWSQSIRGWSVSYQLFKETANY
jgi:hypothetical protein